MKKLMVRQELLMEISIGGQKCKLAGILEIPESASSIILFAHGSGSGRLSPRNQFVANYLQEENLGTLLFDLLTVEEEEVDLETRRYRFNIPLLTERLIAVTKWIGEYESTHSLSVGYFGASTGAAAALMAAAEMPTVRAVVSRGGRADLAGSSLARVQAATLLIVGGNDYGVIELNQNALKVLNCPKKLEIVPGATHLFEETGALEEVCRLASHWFTHYLS